MPSELVRPRDWFQETCISQAGDLRLPSQCTRVMFICQSLFVGSHFASRTLTPKPFNSQHNDERHHISSTSQTETIERFTGRMRRCAVTFALTPEGELQIWGTWIIPPPGRNPRWPDLLSVSSFFPSAR